MMMKYDDLIEQEIKPIEMLEKLGIDFVRLTHEPANSMELCVGIGREQNAEHCKNLFLTNRSGNRFFLVMMDANKPYRTSDVSKKLGSSRLSFGSPDQLREIMGLEPGSVSVLGLVNECAQKAAAEGKLSAALDRTLIERENICVHPNVNTRTLVLKTADVLRFIERSGCPFQIIDI